MQDGIPCELTPRACSACAGKVLGSRPWASYETCRVVGSRWTRCSSAPCAAHARPPGAGTWRCACSGRRRRRAWSWTRSPARHSCACWAPRRSGPGASRSSLPCAERGPRPMPRRWPRCWEAARAGAKFWPCSRTHGITGSGSRIQLSTTRPSALARGSCSGERPWPLRRTCCVTSSALTQ